MKREFLQELTVEGQPLPKAVMDAIMEENGKDIQQAKKSAADYEAARQNAKDWEQKYYEAIQRHAGELAQLRFEGIVKDAITAAGGRNHKAITALLDVSALKENEDPKTAVEQAVAQVKTECDYLFSEPQTPPPYARGTGSRTGETEGPATLAGALREKFERK